MFPFHPFSLPLLILQLSVAYEEECKKRIKKRVERKRKIDDDQDSGMVDAISEFSVFPHQSRLSRKTRNKSPVPTKFAVQLKIFRAFSLPPLRR